MSESTTETHSDELPKGWVVTTLGEVINFINGFAFKSSDYQSKGVKIIRIGDIQNNVLNTSEMKYVDNSLYETLDKKFRVGFDDLVIAMSGATTGKLGFNKTTEKLLLNQRVGKFEFIQTNPKYAFHFLSTKIQENLAISLGSAIPNLSTEQINNTLIPLPPLAEQERIVLKIEELFTKLDVGVAELKQAQAQLKRYRQSVLKAAVTGELTREWRTTNKTESAEILLQRILHERREKWEADQREKFQETGKSPKDDEWKKKYKEPAAPLMENLPELPNGWIWAFGEQLFKWSSGKGLTQKHQAMGAIPVYGGNGINGYHNEELIDFPTIIIGRVGALCGNIFFTKGKAWITDNAIYATYVPKNINLGFIQIAFHLADLNKKAAGSGQPFVNQPMLNGLLLCIPPITEQEKIVEEVERLLSVADVVEKTIADSLQQSERLRQSILQKAFTGKLVPQDESDEPASTLLTRIKAARTALQGEMAKKTKTKEQKPKAKKAEQGNLPY